MCLSMHKLKNCWTEIDISWQANVMWCFSDIDLDLWPRELKSIAACTFVLCPTQFIIHILMFLCAYFMPVQVSFSPAWFHWERRWLTVLNSSSWRRCHTVKCRCRRVLVTNGRRMSWIYYAGLGVYRRSTSISVIVAGRCLTEWPGLPSRVLHVVPVFTCNMIHCSLQCALVIFLIEHDNTTLYTAVWCIMYTSCYYCYCCYSLPC